LSDDVHDVRGANGFVVFSFGLFAERQKQSDDQNDELFFEGLVHASGNAPGGPAHTVQKIDIERLGKFHQLLDFVFEKFFGFIRVQIRQEHQSFLHGIVQTLVDRVRGRVCGQVAVFVDVDFHFERLVHPQNDLVSNDIDVVHVQLFVQEHFVRVQNETLDFFSLQLRRDSFVGVQIRDLDEHDFVREPEPKVASGFENFVVLN
jgi:hypothetical protein